MKSLRPKDAQDRLVRLLTKFEVDMLNRSETVNLSVKQRLHVIVHSSNSWTLRMPLLLSRLL